MSHGDKSKYYKALKAAGVEFDQHYRHYTTEELEAAYLELPEEMQTIPDEGEDTYEFDGETPEPVPSGVHFSDEPLHKIAGLSDPSTGKILRVDSKGVQWLQEEITKSAIPVPRARLAKRYTDTGVKEVQFEGEDGYSETVEVAGDLKQEREVKVTLPSHQVGVCILPQYPFKVITYQGNQGFEYFDIVEFYGAEDLVPEGIKKTYVESVLCFDIRTTVREIQAEARRLQLGIPQEG